jgi:hypothetical protein
MPSGNGVGWVVAANKRIAMIYSRFGTKLNLISKATDSAGQVFVWASSDGTEGIREYRRCDLVADGGMPEIDKAVAGLPLKNK